MIKSVEILRLRWHAATARFRSTRSGLARRKPSTPARFESLENRALLTTFTVTNLRDSGSGSLRDAVASANANPGADVIRFQANLSGKIALTSGQLEITGKLAIDGPQASRIAISGNNASRVFKMGPGTKVSIDDLTIVNARSTIQDDVGIVVTRGGAILNDGGELQLTRVTMRNNRTIAPADGPASRVVGGGAVINSGTATLTATQCMFIGNTASGGTGYAFGGAIGNVTDSVAVIKNCYFADNLATAGGTSYGGAIGSFGSSQLMVTGCTFDGNVARGTDPGQQAFGGAIATRPGTIVSSGSTTKIDHSVFHNNRAIGAAAGAGQSGGDAGGGALYNVASTLFVQRSLFVGNAAIGGNGGIQAGGAMGGAICATAITSADPPLTRIDNCQFVRNLAQGGNSSSGSGSLAAGGAIYSAFGQLDLTSTTIVNNAALGGSNGKGIGGGIYNLATVSTKRVTIRNNTASTSHNNVYGALAAS